MGTIAAICRSPEVNQYLVGLTKLTATRKRNGYKRFEFPHYVVLTDAMSAKDALALEAYLFERTAHNEDQRSLVYRKYHHEKRTGPFRASTGGQANTDDRIYSVYMTWF